MIAMTDHDAFAFAFAFTATSLSLSRLLSRVECKYGTKERKHKRLVVVVVLALDKRETVHPSSSRAGHEESVVSSARSVCIASEKKIQLQYSSTRTYQVHQKTSSSRAWLLEYCSY